MLSLDDTIALPPADDDADERFRQEWVRSVFSMAVDALHSEAAKAGKDVHFAIFQAYDIDDAQHERPSYRELGARFSLPETTITNHLAWARRAFRQHVLDVLRSLAGSEAEYRQDAQELLGFRVQ